MITALIIFLITYSFIGLRQIPRLRIDRPAGALVGAVLMIVAGVITLDEAFAAIDMHTILLLLGMMIITVYLRWAGFFELMADKILSLSRTPMQLLIFVTMSSGLLSALFVNDTICVLYTPIILEVTTRLGIRPIPYLLALATGSNIGSVMTITGNPQNMLIGIYSKIPYLSFMSALFPVAILGFLAAVAVIKHIYKDEMGAAGFASVPRVPEYPVRKILLAKSLMVCAGVLVAFSVGYPYSLAAAAGAVLLLLFGRVSTERILEGVDWMLLLFFSGLFVVMRGVEASGLAEAMIDKAEGLKNATIFGKIAGLSFISAVLSNLVSNVPAVMLLKPLAVSLGGDSFIWLTLAMSSTLAGNFTLIGSVANLIVAQQARRKVDIGFMEYFRVGWLITVITILIGIFVLFVEVRLGHAVEPYAHKTETRQLAVKVFSSRAEKGERNYRVVLLCETPEARAKGLQGFRQLRPDEAALFVFQRPEAVVFWMGSVAYPIDIIFVDPDGKVLRVYPALKPGSREFYPSGMPVRWVIETAAGSGINEGDIVKITR